MHEQGQQHDHGSSHALHASGPCLQCHCNNSQQHFAGHDDGFPVECGGGVVGVGEAKLSTHRRCLKLTPQGQDCGQEPGRDAHSIQQHTWNAQPQHPRRIGRVVTVSVHVLHKHMSPVQCGARHHSKRSPCQRHVQDEGCHANGEPELGLRADVHLSLG